MSHPPRARRSFLCGLTGGRGAKGGDVGPATHLSNVFIVEGTMAGSVAKSATDAAASRAKSGRQRSPSIEGVGGVGSRKRGQSAEASGEHGRGERHHSESFSRVDDVAGDTASPSAEMTYNAAAAEEAASPAEPPTEAAMARLRSLPGGSLQAREAHPASGVEGDGVAHSAGDCTHMSLTASPLLLHLIKLGLSKTDQTILSSQPDSGPAHPERGESFPLKDWSDTDLDSILKELSLIEGVNVSKESSTISHESGTNDNQRGSMPSSVVHSSASHPGSQQQQPLQHHHHHHHHHLLALQQQHSRLIESPDTDSAFSDNASMLSSESSASGGGVGANANPAVNAAAAAANSAVAVARQQKVSKLNAAVSRLSAAPPVAPQPAAPSLQVKIFCADGSTVSVSVESALRAADLLDVLVEKNHVQLQPTWAIVEHLPELYIERCLEDDENVMSVLCSWKQDAKNKLLFVPRPERYDLFRRPERYLLGTAGGQQQQQQSQQLDQQARQALLQDIFYPEEGPSAGPAALEIEGPLWIKLEGKKTWKKQYFALIKSGLYYHSGKPKKSGGQQQISEKDLTCLLPSLDGHQVFLGVGWKKKYKSPSEHALALKPPSAQAKADQRLIVYLCAESDLVMQQWLAAIRIVKNREGLLENYNHLLAKMQTGTGKEELYAAMRFQEEHLPDNAPAQAAMNGGDFHVTTVLQQPQPRDDASDAGNSSIVSSNSSYCSDDNRGGVLRGGGGSLAVPNASGNEKDSSNTSMSSGCLSETSSISTENGFDAEYPDGGTIRRNKQQQQQQQMLQAGSQPCEDDEGNVTPTPAENKGITEGDETIRRIPKSSGESVRKPTMTAADASGATVEHPTQPNTTSTSTVAPVNLTSSEGLGGSTHSLNSLPPPPEELKFPLRYPPSQNAILPRLSAPPQQPQAVAPPMGTTLANSTYPGGQLCSPEVCPPPPPPLSSVASSRQLANFPQPLGQAGSLSQNPMNGENLAGQSPLNSNDRGLNLGTCQQAQMRTAPMVAHGDPNQLPESAIREPLYPCGVFRAVFPRDGAQEPATTGGGVSQMDLLRQLPNNAPPRPFADVGGGGAPGWQPMQQQQQQFSNINQNGLPAAPSAAHAMATRSWASDAQNRSQPAAGGARLRKKSITFNETVVHINLPNSSEPLKDAPKGESSTTTMMKAAMQQHQLPMDASHVVGCWPSSSERNPNPGKLFKDGFSGQNGAVGAVSSTPPRAFLNDLQKVMQKKWTVAQRFHFPNQNHQQTHSQQQQQQQLQRRVNGEEERRLQAASERFANHYNEKDVSMWILESLKHLHEPPPGEADMSQDLCDLRMKSGAGRNNEAKRQQQQSDAVYGFPNAAIAPAAIPPPAMKATNSPASNLTPAALMAKMAHETRPKIYNGRSVPNCFPPTAAERLPQPPSASVLASNTSYQHPPHAITANHPGVTYSDQKNTANMVMSQQQVQTRQQLLPLAVLPQHMIQGSQTAQLGSQVVALSSNDKPHQRRPAPPRRSDATQLTSPR